MTVGNSATTSGASPSATKYKNTIDAFRQVVAQEGSAALMRGAGANILR